MGVIKDRHGTYCARKTVPEKPEGLQGAVALELGNGKVVQKHLKKSLGTKDLREANIRAKPVLAEFDRIIAKAKAKPCGSHCAHSQAHQPERHRNKAYGRVGVRHGAEGR
ncbi:DUF6538 domain-containing protein [Bradyrhizobium liaoningense]|uniref:DUF6538 domain-containing protein n=1 Tax=Bradyrhizobium liaoningense TaxID=43992 RepID=UPI003908A5E1